MTNGFAESSRFTVTERPAEEGEGVFPGAAFPPPNVRIAPAQRPTPAIFFQPAFVVIFFLLRSNALLIELFTLKRAVHRGACDWRSFRSNRPPFRFPEFEASCVFKIRSEGGSARMREADDETFAM
jgi:hypothetical protein